MAQMVAGRQWWPVQGAGEAAETPAASGTIPNAHVQQSKSQDDARMSDLFFMFPRTPHMFPRTPQTKSITRLRM